MMRLGREKILPSRFGSFGGVHGGNLKTESGWGDGNTKLRYKWKLDKHSLAMNREFCP